MHPGRALAISTHNRRREPEMTSIKSGAHNHPSSSDGSTVAVAGVVVAAVLVAAVAVKVWAFTVVYWPAAVVAVAVVLGLAVVVAIMRFVMLDPAARRYWLSARWHRLRWRRLSRNLGLARVDKHDSHRVNTPSARFRPHPCGFTVNLKLIPGVDRLAAEKNAEHLANAWRCHRVGVVQSRPGRLQLRAVRRDPLAEPLSAGVLPPFDGRHLVLGRDEFGQLRRGNLANHSGSCWAGNPGRGKTEAALSLAVQLVTSPLVDMHVLDGGACDWAHFADGAAGYVADDLVAAVDMLAGLDDKMRGRRRTLESDLGVRNAWARGPSPDYRLQWVLVEEAPFYLSLDQVKGDRKREALVTECRGLLAGLLMRGRAPMFHTSLLAQKPTTTSLPSQIRDLCGLRWAFGVSTTETAVACLGESIRQYDTLSPVQLQGDEHVGVASALLTTGKSPYTLLRFPAVGEDLADQVALELARPAAPVCVGCVGDGTDPAGSVCLRCRGSAIDPDPEAPLLEPAV
jgi:S-DNA-T family DNA segregation ATPase FtsK/SpoIIIE